LYSLFVVKVDVVIVDITAKSKSCVVLWQLNNCVGYGVEVIMSCVTATSPTYYAHPHRLVGQDCSAGVARIRIDRVQQQQAFVQW